MDIEGAIAQAMYEKRHEIRATFSAMRQKHGDKEKWHTTGSYDKSLSRQYARVIAPRVAELLHNERITT